MQTRRQIVWRINGHHAALVDDHDALTGLRDFREDVGAENDGVIAGELLDQLPSFDDLLGIEAGGRFVENQDIRVVDERLREPHPLSVALRQLRAQAVGHVRDMGALHDTPDSLGAFGGCHPLDLGYKGQVFDDRHVRIEGRRFGQVAGPLLGLDRLFEHVETGDNCFSGRGRHVAGQNAHGCRLAGAVGAEEAEDFTPFDTETDVVDGGDAAVAFREVLDLNH